MTKDLLYIVPTPIGNLEDITLRAIRVLKEVDIILTEDTRKTSILLKHYNISTRMLPFHKFNEHKTLESIINRIKAGEKLALVSEAGTPGISDPGFLLVRECLRNDIQVECLPGATALIPALVNSGLPCEAFLFVGFLPNKKGRLTKFKELAESPHTLIFYESPFRLIKTLEQLSEHFGSTRRASVSRELTKIYEETQTGTLEELISYFKSKTIKGEIVIVVEGNVEG